MILSILVFNSRGNPRLIKFYDKTQNEVEQQNILTKCFNIISRRDNNMSNFVDMSHIINIPNSLVIYKKYSTLYFCFIVNELENPLVILEFIQVFVESLNSLFENVCELDLIFEFSEVYRVLNACIQNGVILEYSLTDIVQNVKEERKNELEKAGISSVFKGNHLLQRLKDNAVHSIGK